MLKTEAVKQSWPFRDILYCTCGQWNQYWSREKKVRLGWYIPLANHMRSVWRRIRNFLKACQVKLHTGWYIIFHLESSCTLFNLTKLRFSDSFCWGICSALHAENEDERREWRQFGLPTSMIDGEFGRRPRLPRSHTCANSSRGSNSVFWGCWLKLFWGHGLFRCRTH